MVASFAIHLPCPLDKSIDHAASNLVKHRPDETAQGGVGKAVVELELDPAGALWPSPSGKKFRRRRAGKTGR